MINLAVLIPTFDGVEPGTQSFIDSVCNHPEFSVRVLKIKSASIVANRNRLLKRALEYDADWFLCLDSDNSATVDLLLKMIALDEQALFGLYKDKYIKTDYLAGWFSLDQETGKYSPQRHLKVNDSLDCVIVDNLDFSGMGFCLFKRELIESLEYPYILQPSVEMEDGTKEAMLEDVYFCRTLLKAGHKIKGYISEDIKHHLRCEDKKYKQLIKQRVSQMENQEKINVPVDFNTEIGSLNMVLAQMNSKYCSLLNQLQHDQNMIKDLQLKIVELEKQLNEE